MDRETAINEIKKICNGISAELLRIHPAIPALADKPAQDEIYQAIFRLTKELELIKKRVSRLGQADQPRL